jgi:flagellar operon protein (TIGR03826 family)
MAMNVEYCPRCNRLYARNQFGVCPKCLKEIEAQYEACVKYLRENRGCTIQELSDETEVPIKQITKFIRDGRISLANMPNMSYPCEVCGTEIREGHICDSCRSKLAKDVRGLAEDELRRHERQQDAHKGSTYQIKKEK